MSLNFKEHSTSIIFHMSNCQNCPTTGVPRPSCLSIISALARTVFPPWVIKDCLFHVTKSGRFSSYGKKTTPKKLWHSSICFSFSFKKEKQTLKKVAVSIHNALPHISAGVFVRSHDGPSPAGLPSDDKAYTCIWGPSVSHYKAARPNSSNLRN